ncbi:MAG: hypothetical protein JXB07_13920 [Anaerolineae bacterium]|nr:hypothetical protein [Anaerolineae bacterium]
MSHLLCGWPFILVIIGGAIGGALGGLAYAINVAIYKSDLPGFLKIGLNLIVGFMAIGTWIVIAVAITQK